MGHFLDRAKELRANTEIHYNCAQAVLIPFAEICGISEEAAERLGVNFGGGMKMGSVCGAVTSGLMVLGLAGVDDVKTANAFCRKIRKNHDGTLMCADLLRMNAERGGEKKPHCDAMVFEAVELLEEILGQ